MTSRQRPQRRCPGCDRVTQFARLQQFCWRCRAERLEREKASRQQTAATVQKLRDRLDRGPLAETIEMTRRAG